MKRIANGLLTAIAWLAGRLPALMRDAAGLAGTALIAYGLWLIAPPYGFIGGGFLLLVGAILTALAPTPRA